MNKNHFVNKEHVFVYLFFKRFFIIKVAAACLFVPIVWWPAILQAIHEVAGKKVPLFQKVQRYNCNNLCSITLILICVNLELCNISALLG